jgi:hypothetical protein
MQSTYFSTQENMPALAFDGRGRVECQDDFLFFMSTSPKYRIHVTFSLYFILAKKKKKKCDSSSTLQICEV